MEAGAQPLVPPASPTPLASPAMGAAQSSMTDCLATHGLAGESTREQA